MEPKIRFTNVIGPWSVKTIGEMYKFKNGLNKGKGSFGFGTPIINYTDVYKHRGLTREMVKGLVKLDANEIRRYKVKKGDVFFTRTSETPEEVGLASVLLEDIDDCSVSGFVLRGRPITDDLEFDYCKECFSVHAVRDSIIKTCTYTTRALTNGTVLSKIPITIPPKEEQKTIASYFSSLDSLIYSTSKKIESLKQVKAASLQSMFPQERETIPRVRFKGFEGIWEIIKFSDFAEIHRGLTYTPNNAMENGVRVLRSSNIDEDTFVTSKGDIFVAPNCVNIDYAKEGDILITAANGSPHLVGKHAIIRNTCSIPMVAGGFMYLVTSQESEFLNASMSSNWYYRFLKTGVTGGNGSIGNLSRNDLKKAEFLIPIQKEERNMLADYFTSLDSQISLQTQRLEKLKQIKSACLDNMFV